MIRAVVVAAALALGATAVVAQSNIIEQRKAAMKEVGEATKPIGAMLKGEAAFDAAKVQAALATYSKVSKVYGNMFPADSKAGGDTTAAPKIWEDTAAFKAILAKWDGDAAAAAASIKDEASFKAGIGKVLGNCKECHDSFRVKKS